MAFDAHVAVGGEYFDLFLDSHSSLIGYISYRLAGKV